ncbi:MAG: response regulator [Rhodanobacteraceae bacterium]
MNNPSMLKRSFGTVADISSDRRRRRRVHAHEGARILLIEDSVTVTAVLQRMLRQNRYVTMTVAAAEDGVELARRIRPDLIFLDVVLPGMDGFAAASVLRHDPITCAIPVVLMSSSERVTQQVNAGNFEADGFMRKPFSRLDLFSMIERMFCANRAPANAAAAARHDVLQTA